MESLKPPALKKQKHTSPASPATSSKRTGVRWVIGSLSRRGNRLLDDALQSQESYYADLDDSDSDFDVDEPMTEGSNSVSGPIFDKREFQNPCFMCRNPIFDCHVDVFGMAIGDGNYKSDNWGQYSYHLLSKMHQRGPKSGFAARFLN